MAKRSIQLAVERLGLDPTIPWAVDKRGNIEMPPRSVIPALQPKKPVIVEVPQQPQIPLESPFLPQNQENDSKEIITEVPLSVPQNEIALSEKSQTKEPVKQKRGGRKPKEKVQENVSKEETNKEETIIKNEG